MKRLICMALGLFVCAGTLRAEDAPKAKSPGSSEALSIVKKVDAAAKAVKAVTMDVSIVGVGALKTRIPNVDAVCSAVGLENNAPQKWICKGKVTSPGSADSKQLTAGTDGEDFYVIDHSDKKSYVDMDPAVMGRTGGTLGRAIMIEYLHATPFSDEINAKSVELKGSKKIGDEDCYEIRVVYATAQHQESTWWFSKKDFLPRARLQHRQGPAGETGGTLITLNKVTPDPKFKPGMFKFVLPDGFEQVDDFAP